MYLQKILNNIIMKPIQFLDLNNESKIIQRKVNIAIDRVVRKQKFILGEELEAFEKEFAAYLKIKYVIGVNSGTDGLILALKSLNIGPGDEVLVPTLSFVATAIATRIPIKSVLKILKTK